MTPDEYAGAILANRVFARLQVRQMARDLCAEYGFPETILDPPVRPRRPVRLEPDTSFLDDAAAVRREWLREQYFAASVLRPEARIVVTSGA